MKTRNVEAIALIAHDTCKPQLMSWVKENKSILEKIQIHATGTTGKMIERDAGIKGIQTYRSGPLGGDQQIGAAIVEGRIDALIFFWDPLAAQPHDPDVKALIRLATVWNIPTACNQSSADFLINSPLLVKGYKQDLSAIESYQASRKLGDKN